MERTFTEDDIKNAVQFEDAVVFGAHFNFDVHNISGAALAVKQAKRVRDITAKEIQQIIGE